MNLKRQKYFTPLIGLAALIWLSFAQAATDCSKSAQTKIDETECHALVDLYSNTKGANWKQKKGWNVTNTPCNWYGVGCGGGHVTELHLSDNQLSGSLPESLVNLSKLSNLILGNNQISGIPESLGNLSHLQYLYLYNNQLSVIPESLGNLSHLHSLYLYNNLLSVIPESLGNLSHLQFLRL